MKRRKMQIGVGTGQKGGVGKTMALKVVANHADMRGVRWRGLDLDPANKSFLPIAPDKIDAVDLIADGGIRDEAAVTALATKIANLAEAGETDLLLIDLAAGQLPLFLGLMHETGLVTLVGKLLQVTAFYVILNSVDSLSTLAHSVSAFDKVPGTQWVIVRNLREGPLADYDKSKTRNALLGRGALEIDIPLLRDQGVMAKWSESHLSVADFLDAANGIDFGMRGTLEIWAMAIHEQFDLKKVLS